MSGIVRQENFIKGVFINIRTFKQAEIPDGLDFCLLNKLPKLCVGLRNSGSFISLPIFTFNFRTNVSSCLSDVRAEGISGPEQTIQGTLIQSF